MLLKGTNRVFQHDSTVKSTCGESFVGNSLHHHDLFAVILFYFFCGNKVNIGSSSVRVCVSECRLPRCDVHESENVFYLYKKKRCFFFLLPAHSTEA